MPLAKGTGCCRIVNELTIFGSAPMLRHLLFHDVAVLLRSSVGRVEITVFSQQGGNAVTVPTYELECRRAHNLTYSCWHKGSRRDTPTQYGYRQPGCEILSSTERARTKKEGARTFSEFNTECKEGMLLYQVRTWATMECSARSGIVQWKPQPYHSAQRDHVRVDGRTSDDEYKDSSVLYTGIKAVYQLVNRRLL